MVKKTQKNYFGEVEEKAVIDFLSTESMWEKNEIFEQYLKAPLNKMVESIIRRYKLYRKDMDYEEIHNDTISFLMTKIDKFDSTKNHKAYSYFGTICKNYLMGSILKEHKDTTRIINIQDVFSDLEENEEYSYTIDDEPIDHTILISNLIEKISELIESRNTTEIEKKVGLAILDILANYEDFFQVGDGDKFNKNLIFLSIREMTGLNTKDIRNGLKKYKKMYKQVLNVFLK